MLKMTVTQFVICLVFLQGITALRSLKYNCFTKTLCHGSNAGWVYDYSKKACTARNGGCSYVGNFFRTKHDCEFHCTGKMCHFMRCGSWSAPICASNGITYRSFCYFLKARCITKENFKVLHKGHCKPEFICSLPKYSGPCPEGSKRYYYNKDKKRCFAFAYGGCNNNGNNFHSYSKCKDFCQKYAQLDDLESMEKNLDHMYDDAANDRREDFEDRDPIDRENKRSEQMQESEGQEEDGRETEDNRDEEMRDEEKERDEDGERDEQPDGDEDDDASENELSEEDRHLIRQDNGIESVEKETENEDGNSVLETQKAAPKVTYASCEKGMCELNISPIGCFNDNQKLPRPLPDLLDSHRDKTSAAYHGVYTDWKNGESSFRKLACDCVKIARKKNYTYIGLQHYGECWGGKNLTSNYARDGPSKNCVNGKYTACKKGQFCMGKEKANYVYRIDPLPEDCFYEKVGCFYDPVTTHPRPLPELLDSHRDKFSNVYHGLDVEWGSYKHSLRVLIDHCAQRTRDKGYTHFGIEHYGECWSGPHAAKTYAKYGNSTNCVTPDFEKCSSNCQCTGKEHALFVYKLK